MLDFKDEKKVKKLRHTLEDPYDCCFLHPDLKSAILIREYNEDERELEYDNVIVAKVIINIIQELLSKYR